MQTVSALEVGEAGSEEAREEDAGDEEGGEREM